MQEPYLEPHQSRTGAPTAYENLLGDALEGAFGAGLDDLAAIVDRLNDAAIPTPTGAHWTADLLASELRRLGA